MPTGLGSVDDDDWRASTPEPCDCDPDDDCEHDTEDEVEHDRRMYASEMRRMLWTG